MLPLKENKLSVMVSIVVGVIPFLTYQWWSEFAHKIADKVFPLPTPFGVLVTVLLVAMLSLLAGLLLSRAWSGREIERIPKEYKFERKGAILTKNGVEFCSKCFFEHRREVPLKENKGTKILECIADTNHKYERWV